MRICIGAVSLKGERRLVFLSEKREKRDLARTAHPKYYKIVFKMDKMHDFRGRCV